MDSAHLLELVFATTHQSIALLDRDLRFLRVNRVYADDNGQPPHWFVGRAHFELFPHPENEAIFRRVLATGEPFTVRARPFEHPRQPERGTTYWDWSLSPVRSEGRVVGLLLQLLDVTDHVNDRARAVALEARAAQAEKLEAVGLLAAGVAHDVNNALTAILACAELALVEDGAAGQLASDVEIIRTSALRAAETTRRMLAFGRQQVLEPRVLDLRATLEELLLLRLRSIGERVTVEKRFREDTPCARLDPAQLETAVTNLVANALDAMPDGGVLGLEAEARVLPVETAGVPPGRYAVVTVRDSGTGMDEATQRRVFEPFFTTKGQRGTGLGLPSVWGFVQQSGAWLVLDSAPGAGTRVSLFFPAVDEAPDPLPVARAAMKGRRARVLLVDNDDVVRASTRRALESAGHEVLEAATAAGAHELLADRPVDLLVTDVMMRGGTGPELARKARAGVPGLRVLYVSGYVDLGGAGGVLDAPVVRKPYSLDAIRRAVDDALAAGPG